VFVYVKIGFLALLISPATWADDGTSPQSESNVSAEQVPHEDSVLAEEVTKGNTHQKPPPYTLLRYTERYSYLADESNRTDIFDTVKYMPLTSDNPESYLSLGGEIRERYESYHNQGFGVTGPKSNEYGLQRILLHADLHVNERLRFFIQGISSVQFGGEVKSPVNQNPLDFQQGFIDYTFGDSTPDGERLTVRGGRFSMAYGSSRLVATRGGPNTPLKFDGLQIIASKEGKSKIYAFLTRPVKEDRYEFDTPNQDQVFYGIYTTKPINSSLSADLYYLGFKNEQAKYVDAQGVENRHTIGTRLFGKMGNWDYDVEPVYQFGHVGNKDIQAWTLATDAGYTFEDYHWSPRLGLKFDVASGDNHKNDDELGTFSPLFYKATYFNEANLFRPANITDLHLSLQLQPSENLTATFGTDSIWRFSKNDAVYSSTGSVTLPVNNDGTYVGATAEAALQWKVNRHIVSTISYVHFYASGYVENAGGGDVDYIATWMSYLW
jgi:hypothetical protein